MITPAGAPSLKDYGRMVRDGWMLILAAAVLSVGAAWLATSLVTPTYSAQSQVFVTAPGPTSPRAALDGNRSSLVRVESYVRLATSEQVLRRVIVQLDLDIGPDELAKDILVVPASGSALIQIGVTLPDATAARDIANSVAVQLVKLVGEIDLGVGGAVAEVRIVDVATVPDSPASPNLPSNLLLGGGMGLVLGSVLAVGFGIGRDSIDYRDQVDNLVGTRGGVQ